MSTTELLEIINKLPADKQKEVENFVAGLVEKGSIAKTEKPQAKFVDLQGPVNYIADDFDAELSNGKSKLKREFGSLKGFVNYMADDFDEPLEEFKDYI